MLIHVALLLILPIMSQSNIQINVTVASHIDDVIVEYKGEDNKVITDHEEQLYNMTMENLNRGMLVELGKEPDNIFLKDPTRYGNLFNHFKWPEVKRNLRVVKAKVLEVINKESVIKTHEHINNSSDTIKIIRSLHSDMESSIYSSWSKNGLPAEDLYYDIIVNFDETVFKYQNKWRDRTLRSTPIRIAKSKKGFISIRPSQTLVTELKAFKTVFTVRLEYEARLVGNLIGDYDRLYGKYHFYSPTIGNIMRAAGMNNLIKTTESLEVVCYSDPSLNVYDKDTGLNVRSDISRRWFKNLKRNKILFN